MNDRDTHFKSFADLLLRDLEQAGITVLPKASYDYARPLLQKIIAQRAYDLMSSATIDINNAQIQQIARSLHPRAMLRAVEDLTEWPQVEEE